MKKNELISSRYCIQFAHFLNLIKRVMTYRTIIINLEITNCFYCNPRMSPNDRINHNTITGCKNKKGSLPKNIYIFLANPLSMHITFVTVGNSIYFLPNMLVLAYKSTRIQHWVRASSARISLIASRLLNK